MSSLQKHHIVPTYKCKELGLTTSYKIGGKEFYFKENMVEVSRLDHGYIHNGFGTSDLEPLLEVCNPPQWVIDMIPLGDKRDLASAVILAKGEIDGIDISGENHPSWKGGIWANDPVAWKKTYNEVYKQTPKNKAREKAYNDARRKTPEYKEYVRVYNEKRMECPEYKARKKEYKRVYDKKRRATPEFKAQQKAYRATPEFKAKKKAWNKTYNDARHYLRKKLEKEKGTGDLSAFL